MKTSFLCAFITLGVAVQTHAAIVHFDLIGAAGVGLLFGNEPGVTSGGTGGEIGAGITFNDATSVLSINVGWGSANGFTNLTSDVNNQHVHGPTTSTNGNNFTQTAGVAFNLTRSSSSPSSGTIVNNNLTLTSAQVTNLFNGKYYINVHTVNNAGGEIRGFLIPSPRLNVSVGGGQANVSLTNAFGQKQAIQISSNLINWTSVVTNTATGSNLFQFTDSPLQNSQRYYRAVVLP